MPSHSSVLLSEDILNPTYSLAIKSERRTSGVWVLLGGVFSKSDRSKVGRATAPWLDPASAPNFLCHLGQVIYLMRTLLNMGEV